MAKTVNFQADELTLRALQCYVIECDKNADIAQNIDAGMYWEAQKLKAAKQRDELRAKLNEEAEDLIF